jgi:MFS family permease
MRFRHLSNLIAEFPRQFWILFGGTLVNSTGGGMVFPFLTLYLHQHLNLSMTMVGFALTLWAASSLVGQLVGGSLADQLGRKRLIVVSLGLSALLLPIFGFADQFFSAAAIAMLMGLAGAMYQPARDAMVADLVEPARRPRAYALVRVVSNLGIAIGPAIGGFLASRSYMLAFSASAAATFLFFLVSATMLHETKPSAPPHRAAEAPTGSFLSVLRNRPFMVFIAATTLVVIASIQMMTVLPVYMKDQFGLGENYYGWVMTTNAGMVVLLQFPITRATDRLPRMPLIAFGAFLYAAGVGSVALGSTFAHFVAAMAIATLGEMIVVPTSTAVTADLAPTIMRGRYMSLLGLTWTIGLGVGPVLGGLVSDHVAPRAIWPVMASAAIVGATVYLFLTRVASNRVQETATPVAD